MGRPATGVVGLGSGRPSTAAIRLLAGIREPCRLAATSNVDILTGGLLTVDSVVTVAGDRVLLTAQTDASENGIYTASAGPWYRGTDARSPRSITKGVRVIIQEGTSNALTIWEFRTVKPDIGDDDISVINITSSGVGAKFFDQLTIGGTADALTATFSPTFSSRVVGQLLRIRPSSINTAAMTINPDSFGVIAMKMPDGTAIPAGAIQANTDYLLRDDGTNLRIFLSNITF